MTTSEHITCEHCGEPFDPAELDAVVYHAQVPHRPVKATGIRGVKQASPAAPAPEIGARIRFTNGRQSYEGTITFIQPRRQLAAVAVLGYPETFAVSLRRGEAGGEEFAITEVLEGGTAGDAAEVPDALG